MQHQTKMTAVRGATAVGIAAIALLAWSDNGLSARRLTDGGDGVLIKTEAMETPAGEVCAWPSDWQIEEMKAERAAFARAEQQGRGGRRIVNPGGEPIANDPVRMVRDPYSAFAAVAVDLAHDEVIATDENLFQILAFKRTDNTPAGQQTKPLRVVHGDHTQIEFQSNIYIDPENGDLYATNNDTRNKLAVFAYGSNGDVAPIRTVVTPHGAFGVTVDNVHNEMMVTIQHDAAVVTYRKQASGGESPTRVLQGNKTGLGDPHWIVWDPKEDLIFIANYGSGSDHSADVEKRTGVPSGGEDKGKTNWPLGREYSIPGSGYIHPPSIVVHHRTDSGNVAPVRVIQGDKTGLDWPTGMSLDPERRELYVANDAGSSILVFDANASGNVAPKRVIKGNDTLLANPTGVYVDLKHHELWVANFGGHTLTVYPQDANGNQAPTRTIRSAPPEAPSLMIGNPGAVGFDSTREELLVPN